MSSHEAFLRTALMKYQYPDMTKRDILNAFQTFTDLRPNLEYFVFNDGSRRQLLCLDGTIPVTYKGSRYNIPICLWLMDTHPYNPPMCYVKPTSTMQIKPGRHVDNNGKIYLPYLHEWKHPQSDLPGLIQILAIVFGEEPPVFSRAAAAMGQAVRQPYPQAGQSQTPYPQAGAGGYMPMPGLAGPASSPYGGYPPAPGGYPPSTGSNYPATQTPPTYPPQGGAAYPPAGSYPAQGYAARPGYPQQQNYNQGYPRYPQQQPPPPQQQTNVASGATHQPLAAANSLSLSDEQIKASLLSAVEDKMRRRLREIWAQSQAEMDALKKTQEELNSGKVKLDAMVEKLEQETNDVERNIVLLKEKEEEMKIVIAKMENRENIEIDDAVVPTTPLYKQLLNSFAEEQASEDAIYYLGEALRRGVIDLDVFLKKVRELSRKQFMLRALIHKCRQTAGLPEVVSG